jgi:hypothetical protein
VQLAPGDGKVVAELEGPDLINGIVLRVERASWQRIGLRLTFDDDEPQLIPVFDLFGVAWANQDTARSLLFGADADDDLYLYYPMPFHRRAVVEIMRRPVEGPPSVRVEYAIRRLGRAPADDAGRFKVQIRDSRRTDDASEHELLEMDGRGAWVGLFARFGFGPRGRWEFLEGDERIWIDGEDEPSWHGTGIEDLFGGGFYFRGPDGEPVPFRRPLHGAPVVQFVGRTAPVGYRLLLGDAVVFERGVRATIEHLPVKGERVPVRSTAFTYTR